MEVRIKPEQKKTNTFESIMVGTLFKYEHCYYIKAFIFDHGESANEVVTSYVGVKLTTGEIEAIEPGEHVDIPTSSHVEIED